jgi:hypothetical protein
MPHTFLYTLHFGMCLDLCPSFCDNVLQSSYLFQCITPRANSAFQGVPPPQKWGGVFEARFKQMAALKYIINDPTNIAASKLLVAY